MDISESMDEDSSDSDEDYKRDSDEQERFEEMLERLTGAGVSSSPMP